ncbi:MAG: transposase [Okeania sp. SIO2C2]|nr:transposase [Okeania sp. SIO2C2]
MSAAEFAVGIQGHWGIENRLHWIKDVVFGEDTSLIRVCVWKVFLLG